MKRGGALSPGKGGLKRRTLKTAICRAMRLGHDVSAMESLARKQERTKRIIAVLRKTHPDAKLALNFSSPLELLVALILAAQARDERVNQVTEGLFKQYKSAADYAREQPEKLEAQIRKINFFRRKRAAIQGAARVLLARFRGAVPDDLDDLLTLPGVGRKTANVILGNAFGKQAIGVDTHVARVSQRLGLTNQGDPDAIEAELSGVVPKRSQVKFCHLLQFHGRRICIAQKPRCPMCPVNALCRYPEKTKPE